MFKQKETWAIKRHVSPEPTTRKVDKLNLMQENLTVAADTINALKVEREKLKASLRTVLEENKYEKESQSSRSSMRSPQNESLKKQALKEELRNLTKVAMEKDKLILIMEQKINDSRIERAEWKIFNENYSDLKKELTEKNKYIQSLEKRLNEDKEKKGENRETAAKNSVIESLSITVKELNSEKAQWKQLYELLIGLAPEYLERRSSEKSDWQRFSEIILSLKTQNIENAKVIETLNKKIRENNRSDWSQLQEANKLLKQELNSTGHLRMTENFGLLQEIKEVANMLIDRIHSNSAWHSCFKSRFVCSKRFRNMLENQEFPEGLLKLMKVFVDILDESKSLASTKITYQGFDSPKSSRFKTSPKRFVDQRLLESWTQTPNEEKGNLKWKNMQISELEENHYNTFQVPKESSKTEENYARTLFSPLQVNKSIQVIQENFNEKQVSLKKFQASDLKSPKSLSKDPQNDSKRFYQTPQPKNNLKILNTSDDLSVKLKRPSSPKAEEEYLKLIDESQQLLSIIDKQNSRLARINNQISSLVPSDLGKIHENEEEHSYRLEYSGKSARNPEILIGKYSDEEILNLDQSSSPKNERKRSGWDLSALRIPQKDLDSKRPEIEIKRAASPKKDLSQVEIKKRNGRSTSPDMNSDRFGSYTRPKLREENCWNSVADFFGATGKDTTK